MSIFTKIIEGELPCYKIYENDYVFAFLEIKPMVKGHTLIVSKKEVDYFVDVPRRYFQEVFEVSKEIARAMHGGLDIKRVGTKIAGWEVPHFHYHLLPLEFYNQFENERPLSLTDKEFLDIQSSIVSHLK